MGKYKKIAARFFNQPWAITYEKLQELVGFMEIKMNGGTISDETIQAAISGNQRLEERKAGAVAILPISGILAPHMDLIMQISGGTSLDVLTKRFRALVDDSSVGAIILNIDSPGGSVEGLAEFADEVFNARSKKKIVAISNTMAASAAYWIGTAADEFVALRSSWIGSIGVFTVHHEFSKQLEDLGIGSTIISAGKFKTEGNELEPLTESAQAHMQEWIDHFYDMFVEAVARNRGVSVEDVANGFGEGRALPAELSLKENMIDGIETLDELIARLSMPDQQAARARAAAQARQRRLDLAQNN